MEEIHTDYKVPKSEEVMIDKMTVLKWSAPSRLFKKRDRIFFQTVIALVVLIGLILLLLEQLMLFGVILALAFVAYVLATVPPENVEHKITMKGFVSAGVMHRWEELSEFWFEEKWNQKMVVVERRYGGFPGRIVALLGSQDQKILKDKMNDFISFKERPEKNTIDKLGEWLHSRFPFEKAS